MNRSHAIRLHPTPEQEVYFRKACGVARHAYNWALARWKDSRTEGKWAKMNKLGAVNMAETLRWTGKIMSAVISYRAGWWFVSISVEVEHAVPPHRSGAVGIDLGIKTLATCSDGMVMEVS